MESTSQNTYGLPFNKYGLADKQESLVGLQEVNLQNDSPRITIRDNQIHFDTRDCFGQLSLYEAQLAFSFDIVTKGYLEPKYFKETLNSNGIVVLSKLVNIVRQQNFPGFPVRNSIDPYVEGNRVYFKLQRELKLLRTFEIINAIIPRDVIPMYVYFPGFIDNCIPSTSSTTSNEISLLTTTSASTWESPVPETTEDFYDSNVTGIVSNKLGGVYFTPLRYWRSYTGPNCMGNPSTPPPYQLWNPPQDPFAVPITEPWPFQPVPIRGQRIPTYRAKNGVVFAGYGLYDLDDFPDFQNLQISDGTTIRIPLRKLILKLIVPKGQYVNGVSAEDIIDNSISDDFNDSGIVNEPLTQTGYGDYQRFIPGPGLGQPYQPNQWRNLKSAPIDLSVSTYDTTSGVIGPMPVPFPNFRGNVWGPYSRPGDRFQNVSLQLTVDELYLNGDLDNLEGNPIINEKFNPSTESYTFEYYLETLRRINTLVRFSNFETSNNPNIKNAMRVQFDGGFGAVSVSVGTSNTTGLPGPLDINGLPNTQYDGQVHEFNVDVWVEPKSDNPINWIDTLPGPQKPSIVQDLSIGYLGWMYIFRDIFPWTGQIYVPITAGGTGPMEYFSTDNTWNVSSNSELTWGSTEWSSKPVIGQAPFCIPTSIEDTNEYAGNLPWGQVTGISPTRGGTDYISGLPDPDYRLVEVGTLVTTGSSNTIIDVTLVSTPQRSILNFTTIIAPIYPEPRILVAINCPSCSSTVNITPGNNAYFLALPPSNLTLFQGGNNYSIENNVGTRVQYGTGTGLTINIESLSTTATTITGIIDQFSISNPGSGYRVGDIVSVIQSGSNNNALFIVTSVDSPTTSIIPSSSIFHYIDPLAVGPSGTSTGSGISQDIVNGASTCTDPCETDEDNCTPLLGTYQVCIGQEVTEVSTGENDPRPPTNGICTAKCDFVAEESPTQEFQDLIDAGTITCRPSDNARQAQTSNYINRRISYRDLLTGTFITALTNYRSLFISSTPDSEIIIRIKQAQREIYNQSQNASVTESNFNIPIRLNLGTTTGTLEYVEAIQGSLTSSGVYWKKQYYPPKAKLLDLELEFLTYDGTPIPLERTLGFNSQITEQAILQSSSIISTSILQSGNTSQALRATNISNTPSKTVVTGSGNTKTLTNPFSPKLAQFTQRNLSLTFLSQTYHNENPGITHVIKRMPEQSPGVIPVASNLETYNDYVNDYSDDEVDDDDDDDEYEEEYS